jgi:hypothetical protein
LYSVSSMYCAYRCFSNRAIKQYIICSRKRKGEMLANNKQMKNFD